MQEWQLKGATNHPFHLHVYHFQPQENCGDYEAGEYYDTIASSCTVRFDLNPATTTVFEGITIFHCHILDHEDQGAMGWMDVIGGEPAPVYPVGGLFSEYYPLDVTPPATPPADPSGLAAVAVSSSQIDLSWTDNADDEDSYEVEQSSDGTNFALIAVLGANATSHSATGLSPDTTYFYRVSASNTAGTSGYSNVASATTLSDGGGTGTSVEVGAIVVSTNNVGGGFKIGVADITVVDDRGNPVADAVVSGDFTGDIDETITASPPTDAAGLTTVSSTQSVKGKVTLSFCVTAISHPDLQDFSAPPGTVCGSL